MINGKRINDIVSWVYLGVFGFMLITVICLMFIIG